MAKRKIGVSLLAMFAMVLMFSISAMAAGVTGLKANVENNTLRASWTALADATNYTITITDVKTGAKLADAVVVTETSYTTAVEASKKYSVKVASNSTANPDAVTIEVWAPASNSVMPEGDENADNNIGNANQTGTGAAVEDGTKAIGPDGVIKSGGMVKNDGTTGTHRTHGEYQNNTNSCASCHQTHTGASKSLLFKDGVYNTCTACHDGTLGMYNVFEHSNAGTFGGTETGNMSVHLADGSVQVKAAPGGNLSSNSGAWVNEFNCASCHSPHGSYSDRLLHYNPNGMGQKAKADGGIGLVGTKVYPGKASLPLDKSVTGMVLVRDTATILGITGIPGDSKVITVMNFVEGKYGAPNKWELVQSPWLYGYGYASPNKNYYTRLFDDAYKTTQAYVQEKIAGKAQYFLADGTTKTTESTRMEGTTKVYNEPVMVPAFWDEATKKVVTTDNGVPHYDKFELTFDQATGTWHYKWAIDNHDQDWNSNLKIVWSKGYIYTTAADTVLDNVDTGDIARAYTVDLDLQEIAKFGDGNGVPVYTSNVNALFDGTKSGSGVQMSTYCASCHTDYLAHSGDGDVADGKGTGTWNQAYRHSTDSDSYTCVRCHFAHGTDVTVMMDAEGHKVGDTLDDKGTPETTDDIIATTDYLLDQNPSSALKRYTNMSVCWGCHTDSKAEQLKNTGSYGDDNDPHGLVEQPAMPGTINDANGDKVIINGN